jgi:hypothetical protein
MLSRSMPGLNLFSQPDSDVQLTVDRECFKQDTYKSFIEILDAKR